MRTCGSVQIFHFTYLQRRWLGHNGVIGQSGLQLSVLLCNNMSILCAMLSSKPHLTAMLALHRVFGSTGLQLTSQVTDKALSQLLCIWLIFAKFDYWSKICQMHFINWIKRRCTSLVVYIGRKFVHWASGMYSRCSDPNLTTYPLLL
jgi:hypothetical protein